MNASLWQLAAWTMIHSLWLGAAVALAGGFLRLASRRAAPNTRYAISLATLALLAAAPIAAAGWLSINGVPQLAAANPASASLPLPLGEGWGEGQPGYTASHPSLTLPRKGREPEEQGSPATTSVIDLAQATPAELDALAAQQQSPQALPANSTAPLPLPPSTLPLHPSDHQSPITDHPSPTYSPTHLLTTTLPHLPTLWLIGAPLTFTLLATGLVGSERLRRRATPLLAGPAHEACERLRQTLNITRRVALAASDGVAQPILVGIVRPLILLPTAALAGWTPEQLDMVLLHELAHVRRWDNLVNLAQRIVESLLFFHPAVWLLSRQVRRDREECCDAAVIRHTNRPEAYATLLIDIASRLRLSGQLSPAQSLTVASAMASHPLAGRIRRILNLEAEPMRITRRTLAATLLLPLLLAGAIFYSGANAEDSPPVKPSSPGSPNRGGAATGSISEETQSTAKASSGSAAPVQEPEPSAKSGENEPAPENDADSYAASYPIKPDTRIDLFDLVRSLGGHNLKLDMVANEWVIILHAPKQAHNRLRVLLGDPTLPQPAKPVAQPAELSWNNTPAAAAQPLLGSNAADRQQEIIVHFPTNFPNSDLERERIRKALVADGNPATLTSLKSMSESATGEIEEKSIPCLRVNVPDDWHAKPVWETNDGRMTCRIINDPSTARLAPPYSGPRYSAPADGLDSPNQRAVVAGSNAWNAQPTANVSIGAGATVQESEPPSPFPTLENQKIADRAYKLLGLELEPADGEDLRRIKKLGYNGGLRITRANEMAGTVWGDLLVGLHAWPVTDFKSLNEVLLRDDLGELNPLKYYVVRKEGSGRFGSSPDGEDVVVTGRLQIPDAELLSRGLELTNQAVAQLTASAPTAGDYGPDVGQSAADALDPFANHAPSSSPDEVDGPPTATFLYDGKTFDQWRDLWKLELKTERRTEAINALAAFARAGYGREAADAMLEIANQYDFHTIDESAEGKLKRAVIDQCTRPYGNRVAARDWLPALEQLLKKDPAQTRWLAEFLLAELVETDDEVKAALERIEAFAEPEVRDAAKLARTWADELLAELMKSDADGDQQLSQPEADASKRFQPGIFQSIDADHDGQLSDDELRKCFPMKFGRRSSFGRMNASARY